MPQPFHEILFPLDIALKNAGGPERRTEIVTLGSGHEERNSRWADSRRPDKQNSTPLHPIGSIWTT